MSNILIMAPLTPAAISTSRGTGAQNLLTSDPKEIWLDSTVGSAAQINIDLGVVQVIDTVFLGSILGASADATWTITGGAAGYTEFTIKPAGALRVPERLGKFSYLSHAFWTGGEFLARYVRISLTQPSGPPLSVGVLALGDGFQPAYNQEWGAGRGVKDTGTVTRLPSGSAVSVEGARYGSYSWTLGDLSDDETEALYELQLQTGETRVALVVEDPATTAGLRNRLHYALMTNLRPYTRRSSGVTQWDMAVDDLIPLNSTPAIAADAFLLTLGGEPLTLGGDFLTIGA